MKQFNNRSFTLIELVIVISITLLLFSAGFLKLLDYRQHQALKLTKQNIAAVLRNAQNLSISQESGNRWGIHFENPSGSGNDFYELFSGVSYSTSTVISKNNLDPELQFNDPASGVSENIIFLPLSGKLSAAASINISLVSDTSVSSTIIINANGQIEY
ncbi:MAG TPA: type II secretion system protein [Candidatus Wolfebacteria bacterium]|nr:type II secretion system protein [Candidatus Wolfebacteria bacterium]